MEFKGFSMRWVTGGVTAVIAIAFVLNFSASPAASGPAKQTKKEEAAVPAPPFSLMSLGGKPVTLKSQRGKWVFVNFWAKWCGPCVAEMPMIENLAKKMKGRPFEILAINVDDEEPDAIKTFMSRKGLTFTVLLDRNGTASESYGINALPMTFLVNPSGEVVAKALGPREWDSPEMLDYLTGLMKDGGMEKS
ncbi:MAG: redoxin family protein [Nitrospinae bacterium]|nr:redoxin family protein [Nitrospinota bacterium]